MMSIVSQNDSGNPFDSIRRIDENGIEYWEARELMPLLGYTNWRQFNEAISRAIASCNAQSKTSQNHFELIFNVVKRKQGGGSRQENYRLSRYGAYLVAMNGDPRKPEIAAAQSYFVAKTREAEVVIPQQDTRIKELELMLKLAEAEARKALAEKSLLDTRHLIVSSCPEPVQQKILGYQTVEKVEYRDRILVGGDLINDGSTMTKTELCKRYGFITKSGSPDFKKLNKHLESLPIPEDAWRVQPSVRDNKELTRDYLPTLDRMIMEDSRQLWFGE